MFALRSLLSLTLALLAVSGSPAAARAASPNSRWAFLVGVDQYAQLKDLEFAAADQRALAELLPKVGFPPDQIILLDDRASRTKYQPTRLNVLRELDLFLKLVSPGDVVVIGFSGHGVCLSGKSYFCPADASLDNPPETMLSVDDVFAKLSASPATFKLLLVDACRNDPHQNGQRNTKPIREVNDFTRTLSRPPEGLLIISSCGHDQVAWEDKEFGHGVFMHFLLDGLKGKAADTDGSVRLMRLYDYASIETKKYVQRKFSAYQSPAFEGKSDGPFELARIERVGKMETPAQPPSVGSTVTPVATSGETIVNSAGMKLVVVPAGEFLMGNEESLTDLLKVFPRITREDFANASPRHQIRIKRPFYLGVFEVTRAQFRTFVNDTNYKTDAELYGFGGSGYSGNDKTPMVSKKEFSWREWGGGQDDDHPVVNVSWNDANAYCQWLSRIEDKVYRLPTEAEWEYACRAGTKTLFSCGNNPEDLVKSDNVLDGTAHEKWKDLLAVRNSDGYVFTAPVGRFRANSFGLFDMHGNVSEWCADRYDRNYYSQSPLESPEGASGGTERVCRGGSWFSSAVNCRSADRMSADPTATTSAFGFRVLCEIELPARKRRASISNTLEMKFVDIPAGEFLMGGEQDLDSLVKQSLNPSRADNVNTMAAAAMRETLAPSYPQHPVRITRPFYLGAHEVTQAQFRSFVDATHFITDCEQVDAAGKSIGGSGLVEETPLTLGQRSNFNWRNLGFEQSDDGPVVNVSRDDAIAFCKWLGQKEGRIYRLPTEAEWEYACRAGSTTHYSYGDDANGLVRVGNVADASLSAKSKEQSGLKFHDGFAYLAPVGRFLPNRFGLYDMHGNAREWCADNGDAKYYALSPIDNPQGPTFGEHGVVRGGSFYDLSLNCFSAFRWIEHPNSVGATLGFRVVCEP